MIRTTSRVQEIFRSSQNVFISFKNQKKNLEILQTGPYSTFTNAVTKCNLKIHLKKKNQDTHRSRHRALLFFFFLRCIALGILVPHQRRNPRPLQWGCRAFTPGHQGSPWPCFTHSPAPRRQLLTWQALYSS